MSRGAKPWRGTHMEGAVPIQPEGGIPDPPRLQVQEHGRHGTFRPLPSISQRLGTGRTRTRGSGMRR